MVVVLLSASGGGVADSLRSGGGRSNAVVGAIFVLVFKTLI